MPPEEVPATALVCRQIRLRHFRNFAALDLEFPTAGAAIIGDNGSGKTNLLEAVHYLEIFRSFRGAASDAGGTSTQTSSSLSAPSSRQASMQAFRPTTARQASRTPAAPPRPGRRCREP